MKPLVTLFHTVVALAVLSSDQTHGFSRSNLPKTTKSCPNYHDNGCILSRPHVCASSFRRTNARTAALSFSSRKQDDNDETTPTTQIETLLDSIKSNPKKSIYFSTLMTLCGAALGPFLDSYHSLFGVLSYETPLVFPILGSVVDGSPELLTCVTTYWVPPLFGLAGFIIGWLYIGLDAALVVGKENDDVVDDSNNPNAQQQQQQLHPTIPKVLVGISYFTFQYWLSGILFAHGVERTPILILMSSLAAGGFYALDGTLSGFITSAATAIGGPLIEVGLISSLSGSWGYHYNDAGETGFFPLWIIPVYFLGGPANGNLARAFWNALGDDSDTTTTAKSMIAYDEEGEVPTMPVRKRIACSDCQGTRAVQCPNCDDGTYVTYGERVVCKACRGKGMVICRSCFSSYGDDPNDIENIRRIMDQILD